MADSPAPTESLIKAESEPQRDPIVATSTSAIILVSTLLMIFSAGWALYDEAYGQRPWKGMQREFVKRYSAYLKSIRKDAGKSEAEVKESPEYEQLDADAKAAEERVRDRRKEIDNQVAKIQAKLDAVTEPFQNQRGRIVVITYKLETARKGSLWERYYKRQLNSKKDEVVTVDMPADGPGKTTRQPMKFAELEQAFNDLRDEKAKALGEKAELLKEPTELAKKRDDYLKNHVSLLPQKSINDLINKNENSFDYTILGHQINVNDYGIVDRCELCHLGADADDALVRQHHAQQFPRAQAWPRPDRLVHLAGCPRPAANRRSRSRCRRRRAAPPRDRAETHPTPPTARARAAFGRWPGARNRATVG